MASAYQYSCLDIKYSKIAASAILFCYRLKIKLSYVSKRITVKWTPHYFHPVAAVSCFPILNMQKIMISIIPSIGYYKFYIIY